MFHRVSERILQHTVQALRLGTIPIYIWKYTLVGRHFNLFVPQMMVVVLCSPLTPCSAGTEVMVVMVEVAGMQALPYAELVNWNAIAVVMEIHQVCKPFSVIAVQLHFDNGCSSVARAI
jgi:hypothetical protein